MPTGDTYVMHEGVWRGLNDALDIIPSAPPSEAVPIMASFVGMGPKIDSTGAVTPSYPVGTLAGMYAILVVETAAQTPATPSGWAHADNGAGTPVSPQNTGTGGADDSCGLSVFVRRVTVDGGDPVTVADSGDHNLAQIFIYKDIPSTGNVIGVGAGNVQASADTSVEYPSVTTTGDKRLIVLIGAHGIGNNNSRWNDDLSNTALTSLTRRDHWGRATGVAGGGYCVGDGGKALTGVVGQTNQTLIASGAQARITLALLPGLSTDPGGGGGGTPQPGGDRTMFAAEGLEFNPSLFGVAVTPDPSISDTSSTNWVTATTGWIDRLIAANACCLMKVTPSNNSRNGDGTYKLRNADGTFSPSKWITQFLLWWNGMSGTSQTKVRTNVGTGVIRALYALDDFAGESGSNAFVGGVTFAQLEEIGAAVKNVAPWLPIFLRGSTQSCRSLATSNGVIRQYQYIDSAQASYRPKTDRKLSTYTTGTAAAQAKVAADVAAGGACGLACLGWMNILNWGGGSAKGGWDISGSSPTQFGMSPSEILEAGRALLGAQRNGASAVHGITLWAYQVGTSVTSAYYDRSDIQSPLATLWSEMTGRTEGPQNIRGDLVAA